jgi:hypothetical protein
MLTGLCSLGIAMGVGGIIVSGTASLVGSITSILTYTSVGSAAMLIIVSIGSDVLLGIRMGIRTGWQCAMEFYDNGLIQGLSFPFRYIIALNVSNEEMNKFEYTAIPALKKDAEEIISTHTQTVISTLHKNLNVKLPSVLSNIVIHYALTPTDSAPIQPILPMPKLVIRRIALWRENRINPIKINFPETTAGVLSEEETHTIIKKVLNSKLLPNPKEKDHRDEAAVSELAVPGP